ncbi:hypothetical protein GCM10022403_040340 [Streptomyces coacervatus]|uniref:Transposase n=1 Tax=Streptomyces coacervatus TaxID=647381 RepID=A0ABP7HYS0_9ACTN
MAQARPARLGGDVQDVEAVAHAEPYRRSGPSRVRGHCRPAQFVLVPTADLIARIERPAGERDRREAANHAKGNRAKGLRVTLGVLSDAQSAGKGGVRGCGVAQGCSPIAERTGARGMECQSQRVRHP